MNYPVVPKLTRAKAALASAGYRFSNVGKFPTINGRPIDEPMKTVIQANLVEAGFARSEAAELIEKMTGGIMVNN